jgi:hypothetical protein
MANVLLRFANAMSNPPMIGATLTLPTVTFLTANTFKNFAAYFINNIAHSKTITFKLYKNLTLIQTKTITGSSSTAVNVLFSDVTVGAGDAIKVEVVLPGNTAGWGYGAAFALANTWTGAPIRYIIPVTNIGSLGGTIESVISTPGARTVTGYWAILSSSGSAGGSSNVKTELMKNTTVLIQNLTNTPVSGVQKVYHHPSDVSPVALDSDDTLHYHVQYYPGCAWGYCGGIAEHYEWAPLPEIKGEG